VIKVIMNQIFHETGFHYDWLIWESFWSFFRMLFADVNHFEVSIHLDQIKNNEDLQFVHFSNV